MVHFYASTPFEMHATTSHGATQQYDSDLPSVVTPVVVSNHKMFVIASVQQRVTDVVVFIMWVSLVSILHRIFLV